MVSPTEAGSPAGPAFVMPDSVPDHAALWLVRHGETEWSVSGQHTSWTDLPLTQHGEEQAKSLAPLLSGRAYALALTSPLARASFSPSIL